MSDTLPSIDVDHLRALDLHQAESRFDEIKTQLLSATATDVSLSRIRTYLHAIEDILAERHEARRSESL